MNKTEDYAMQDVFAQLYWEKTPVYKPCFEIQVNEMEIIRQLTVDEAQRKKAYGEYNNAGKIVEMMSIYRELLNKVIEG